MDKTNPKYRDVKRLLRKGKYPTPFGGKYMFSPYMACGHACRYCDGRAERYHVEGDFDLDITVRRNTPDLLAKELPRLRERGPICISSGISDPYQPIEQDEKLMRRCAEILVEFDFPVTIHTKSSLVLRDLDLWQRLHKKSAVHLMVSLTFTDDKLRRTYEPGASSVEERLAALTAFHEAGLFTGVLAMPFIPFISDSEDQISRLLEALANIGVDFVMPAGLTLRPGRQKEMFLSTVKESAPHLSDQITGLYDNTNPHGSPCHTYRNKLSQRISALTEANALPEHIPHYTYQNQFAAYDEIRILMSHLKSLYRARGINTARLARAEKLYNEWLMPRKTYYARRRNLSYRSLEAEVIAMVSSGHPTGNSEALITSELYDPGDVIQNRKLAAFFASVFCDGLTFDYLDLSLKKNGRSLPPRGSN